MAGMGASGYGACTGTTGGPISRVAMPTSLPMIPATMVVCICRTLLVAAYLFISRPWARDPVAMSSTSMSSTMSNGSSCLLAQQWGSKAHRHHANTTPPTGPPVLWVPATVYRPWLYASRPNPCSWLVVGYSILSHPLATGVETAATTAHPRNGVTSLKH